MKTNPCPTTRPSLTRQSLILAFIVLGAGLLAGCSSPITDPSRLMVPAAAPNGAPPQGKSEVLIHRPRNRQGYPLYTGVWDSHHFVADLGNGHSTAYVCDPGTHYFINRSVERVGVVEATLLPDQVYDLWVNIAGAWIASFQLEPVKPGSEQQKKLPVWEKDHLWVTRGPEAAGYEQEAGSEIDVILRDFVTGPKKDRVRHLGAEDHRAAMPSVNEFASSDPDEIIHKLKLLRSPECSAAVPQILPLLHHENPNVQRDACRTLAVIGNKDIIPSIEPLLNSPRADVRRDAQEAIDQLRSKQ